MSGFFKGASLDQDGRFPDKQKKLLSKMQFPPEYDQKVDLKNVRLDLLRPFITQQIVAILGLEDDVVIDLIMNSLEQSQKALLRGSKDFPLDPRELQITLTGFLEKNAKPFVTQLWSMLISAASSPTGIPAQLLEAKKSEIIAAKEKAMEMARLAAATATANAAAAAAAANPLQLASTSVPPSAPVSTPRVDASGKRISRFGPRPSDSATVPVVTPMVNVVPPASVPIVSSSAMRYDDRRDRDSHRHHSRSRSRSPRRSDRSSYRNSSDYDRDRERERSRTRSRSRSRDHDRERRHHSSSSRHRHRHHREPEDDQNGGHRRSSHHHSRSRSRSHSPNGAGAGAVGDEGGATRTRSHSRSPSREHKKKSKKHKKSKKKSSRHHSRSRSRSRTPSQSRSRSRSRTPPQTQTTQIKEEEKVGSTTIGNGSN